MHRPVVESNHAMKRLRPGGRAPRPTAMLWRELEKGQVMGYEFARAHPLCDDHVAFYCEQLGLAIAVDPIIVSDRSALRSARRRDGRLAGRGIRLLRFSNDEVTHNLDGVVACIRRWIRSQPERWGSSAATKGGRTGAYPQRRGSGTTR